MDVPISLVCKVVIVFPSNKVRTATIIIIVTIIVIMIELELKCLDRWFRELNQLFIDNILIIFKSFHNCIEI